MENDPLQGGLILLLAGRYGSMIRMLTSLSVTVAELEEAPALVRVVGEAASS